ncbi:deaminase domain-containing protein [Clostridium sp. HCP1S3_B4]|uniref:deaminase domain-containing protein n=1 Tax=unclassified Clostridium TaxID=2614128 RepID=UPI003F88CD7C
MPNTNLSKRGNMAAAEVDIDGIKKEFVAHSKINSVESKGSNVSDFSYLKPENERLFTSYVVDKFPRYHDTEAKILEDIAGQIKDPNISGTINLYSELPCCQSCSNIILEFRRKFPNIKLNIYVE